MNRLSLAAALLCAFTKLLTSLPYFDAATEIVVGTLNHTISDPYRYRILGVELANGLAHLTPFLPYGAALMIWIYAVEALSIVGFLLLLCRWLSLYRDQRTAALWTVYAALMIALIPHSFFHGYQWVEPMLVMIALLCLRRPSETKFRQLLTYALLVMVACLNRETGLYLVVLYAFSTRRLKASLLLALIGAATPVAIRMGVGIGDRYWTLPMIFARNLEVLPESILNTVLLLGIPVLLAALGWSHTPPRLRVLAWTLPLYLVPVLVGGIWNETRLFIPILPILLNYASYARIRVLHPQTA